MPSYRKNKRELSERICSLVTRARWALLKRFRPGHYYRRLAEYYDGETLEWLLVKESGALIQRAMEFNLDISDVSSTGDSEPWITTEFGTHLDWDTFR